MPTPFPAAIRCRLRSPLRSVHDAPEDGDLDRLLDSFERLSSSAIMLKRSTSILPHVGQAMSSTLRVARLSERRISFPTRLPHRFVGEGDPYRVSDPFREKRPDPHGRLDCPGPRRSGLRNAQMERDVRPFRNKPVRLNHEADIG